MQMAQNKEEVFRNGAACALRRKKEGAYYMDDFTINFAITLIVLLIGLAFIGEQR